MYCQIETHLPVSKRYRTVRLVLGDGELCIQTLLRPELHRFVDSGQVYVGCYVRLTRFEVRSILVRGGPSVEINSREAPEEMVFLVARDLMVIGWNTAYMQMAGTTMQEAKVETVRTNAQASSHGPVPGDEQPPQPLEALVVTKPAVPDEAVIPNELTAQSRNEAATDTHLTHPASDSLSWVNDDLSKPLKLTSLKSIPNLPYKQNWVVNILAIVVSLSDVETATLPPFKQRTARLTDPSTNKHVLLTVFLDPDNFTPAVGNAVLLLGVKNHRFDGGSLKKYGNERIKEGSRWWFEDPSDIEWCDVEGLKKWWTQTYP
ncbi:hypothetical protein N0V82_007020 [Gnomoniopsis sp. IMI 355080]|nr:hypothetical protein N0V82_007020 [Gnomoniopsis sp. IMI 355080]